MAVEKSGKVYQYLEVQATGLEDKLKKGIVTILVEKSWLSSNGLDIDDIALFRFNEVSEEWGELGTTYMGSEGNNELYDVELTEFSFFAISTTLAVDEVEDEGGIVEDIGDIVEEAKIRWWWWIILGVVLIVTTVVVIIIIKRKTKDNFTNLTS